MDAILGMIRRYIYNLEGVEFTAKKIDPFKVVNMNIIFCPWVKPTAILIFFAGSSYYLISADFKIVCWSVLLTRPL